MNMLMARIWSGALIALIILLDQVSKAWILSQPALNGLACLGRSEACGRIVLAGPVDLTMLWNRGMSYGLLQSEGLMRWVLAAVMAAIAAGFFVWLLRAEGRALRLALALVIGGAIGNLIDRVRFGAVVDFIDVNELTMGYFPWIFNVADSAITVGAILLFADQMLLSRRKQARHPEQG